MDFEPDQVLTVECKAEYLQRIARLMTQFENFDTRNKHSTIWPDLRGDVKDLLIVDPQEIIQLQLPRRNIPIFACLRFVSMRLESVPDAIDEVALRWTELFHKFPNKNSPLPTHEILATAYESAILLRTRIAGYETKFIPTDSKTGQTPDLVCEEPRFLIECKDCQGSHGYTEDSRKIIKWARRRILDGRQQMDEYDVNGDYAHFVCLDMPEGFAVNTCWEQPGFSYNFFKSLFTFQNRKTNPSPEDGNVYFTSIDFNQHYQFVLGETSEPRHESWFRQVLAVGAEPMATQLLSDIRSSLNVSEEI